MYNQQTAHSSLSEVAFKHWLHEVMFVFGAIRLSCHRLKDLQAVVCNIYIKNIASIQLNDTENMTKNDDATNIEGDKSLCVCFQPAAKFCFQ